MLYLATASFLERELTGIGPANVEAAAKTMRPVRDHRLKQVELMLLTES